MSPLDMGIWIVYMENNNKLPRHRHVLIFKTTARLERLQKTDQTTSIKGTKSESRSRQAPFFNPTRGGCRRLDSGQAHA
jgi:hypothetical protein